MNETSKADLAGLFFQTFSFPANTPLESIVYGSIAGWDSLNHLTLIAAIEERFGVMLDTEDVLDLSSFAKAVEIMDKYVDQAV